MHQEFGQIKEGMAYLYLTPSGVSAGILKARSEPMAEDGDNLETSSFTCLRAGAGCWLGCQNNTHLQPLHLVCLHWLL